MRIGDKVTYQYEVGIIVQINAYGRYDIKTERSTICNVEEKDINKQSIEEIEAIKTLVSKCTICGEELKAMNAYWYNKGQREHCGKNKDGLYLCAYCRNPIQKDDLLQGTVFSPNWKANGYRSPMRNYHQSKGCNGYDQMAHEG